MSDQGTNDPRGVTDVNTDNQNKMATTQSTIQAPNLQVYRPDYSALESSFNQILQSYQGFRDATQAQHDAQKSSLDSSLEQSVRNIGQAKETTTEQFGKARNQLSTDLFEVGRSTQAQMSARGLAGSGIEAMANIQNRMAAGESLSDMSNDFFDAQTQLVQAEEDARTNYNNNLQSLSASLQGAMAQIMSQEASSRMDYTQMVENLKRQVVMDTNAVNESMAQWNEAQRQLSEGTQITNTMVRQVVGDSSLLDEDKIAALTDFGYSRSEAESLISKSNLSASQRLQADVQQQINNIWANNGTAEDVQAYISQLLAQGVPVEVDKLAKEKPTSPQAIQRYANTTSWNKPISNVGIDDPYYSPSVKPFGQ